MSSKGQLPLRHDGFYIPSNELSAVFRSSFCNDPRESIYHIFISNFSVVMSRESYNMLVDAALVPAREALVAESTYEAAEITSRAKRVLKISDDKLHIQPTLERSGDVIMDHRGLTTPFLVRPFRFITLI